MLPFSVLVCGERLRFHVVILAYRVNLPSNLWYYQQWKLILMPSHPALKAMEGDSFRAPRPLTILSLQCSYYTKRQFVLCHFNGYNSYTFPCHPFVLYFMCASSVLVFTKRWHCYFLLYPSLPLLLQLRVERHVLCDRLDCHRFHWQSSLCPGPVWLHSVGVLIGPGLACGGGFPGKTP